MSSPRNFPPLFTPSLYPFSSLPFTKSPSLQKPSVSRPHSSRATRRSFTTPTMEWKPAGLLHDAVNLKKFEIELMEKTLKERPDHPVNMRRSFFAQKPVHRFSRALHRRDETLSIVLAMKRFQPVHGDKPTLVAPLEQIGLEARRFESFGVDAALLYTDAMQYGVETPDLGKVTRDLKSSNQDLGMPVARQDIIVDPIQIAEAAEAGACAVNIVAAAALPDLLELMNAATAMGIEAMVECHTSLEVEFAMECGATILFLSNFDRTRNAEVKGRALELANGLPPWITRLGGGGLVTAGDCWKYLEGGFHGVVLGRTLLQTRRPEGFIQEIRSQKSIAEDVFARGLGNPFGS
eukprot:GFKZ01004152.1.p2 GENE.GFKZ01004152.1~~GFKZ01004152.1.p2  ORF type:complete len:350 (+),score=44.09 GFKZ01004152.1:229-1278(+)